MPSDCDSIQDLLVDFADGELAEAGMHQVREHLERCGHCRDKVERLRISLDLAHELWRDATGESAEFVADLKPRRAPVRALLGLAAATVLLLTGWLVLPFLHETSSPPIREARLATLDPEAESLIAREGAAARLLAAAELLSNAPAGHDYACARFEYIAEVFPESTAGQTARARFRERCDERNRP